jgi:hypothetical protein
LPFGFGVGFGFGYLLSQFVQLLSCGLDALLGLLACLPFGFGAGGLLFHDASGFFAGGFFGGESCFAFGLGLFFGGFGLFGRFAGFLGGAVGLGAEFFEFFAGLLSGLFGGLAGLAFSFFPGLLFLPGALGCIFGFGA